MLPASGLPAPRSPSSSPAGDGALGSVHPPAEAAEAQRGDVGSGDLLGSPPVENAPCPFRLHFQGAGGRQAADHSSPLVTPLPQFSSRQEGSQRGV